MAIGARVEEVVEAAGSGAALADDAADVDLDDSVDVEEDSAFRFHVTAFVWLVL